MKKLLYIDLFCGAGGTSTGVNSARLNGEQCADVIACVNHDANAIASHASNHPDALHFTEDIRTLELSPLIEHLKKCREDNPGALVVLWASLECTNFSKAKGGQPRDADSRTLAEHLFRYIEAITPDYIQIENVEEFMSWGEVDENGKPVSMDKGKSYTRWVRKVKSYGYRFDHRILNSADYGAYTSRKRFFGIFAKGDLPIVFPHQTHDKNGTNTLFGSLAKWKPVKEVLDFADEGKTIFRDKPLSEKTLEVQHWVYIGIERIDANGNRVRIFSYDLPREVYERRNWVVRWREAKCRCQYPKDNVQCYFSFYDKRLGNDQKLSDDLRKLISCKAQVSKQQRLIDEYIDWHRKNDLFFDENTDTELLKIRKKLAQKTVNVQEAEQRLKMKIEQIKQSRKGGIK